MKQSGHKSAEAALCVKLALGAAAMGMLWGCVLPMDYHTTGSRHNVNEEVQARLKPGVSTNEDVFLLLGEPDRASEDGRRIGYAWSKVKFIWFLCGRYNCISGDAKKSYLLQISFDEYNRVAHMRFQKAWGEEIPAEQMFQP